jgi:hypothetical protein
MSLDYLSTQADWSDHFFGTKMDRSQIGIIQAMVEEIDRRGGLPAGGNQTALNESASAWFRASVRVPSSR